MLKVNLAQQRWQEELGKLSVAPERWDEAASMLSVQCSLLQYWVSLGPSMECMG